VAFSLGNKAYVGIGAYGTPYTYYYDFYAFNPDSNTWKARANFPGAGRVNAYHFSIGDKGYVGSGNIPGTYFTDLWEYNSLTNTWTQKNNPPFSGRSQAIAFTIGRKGYVGTGILSNGTEVGDLWEYDPDNDTWVQKASMPGGGRYGCVGFSMYNYGYVGVGYTTALLQEFWQYDPAANAWTQLPSLPGAARSVAIGFNIGQYGYIGTGADGNGSTSYLNDFWQYTPSWLGVENPTKTSTDINVYPNPATNSIIIEGLANTAIAEVYDLSGKIILAQQISTNQIDISTLAEGLYFIKLTSPEGSVVRKFVKE
jgi:N-acetylneuraminic acid mutarotase